MNGVVRLLVPSVILLLFYRSNPSYRSNQNHRSVILLFAVSKVFENFLNNKLVDHLEKCGLFSNFQYGFRSIADLLTVLPDRIARPLTDLGLLELQHLYPRLSIELSILVFFTKFKSYGISGQIFGLVLSFF